jgi:hypothetical protein
MDMLANRVRLLDERYASTASELENEFEELSEKVKADLLEMGFSWA